MVSALPGANVDLNQESKRCSSKSGIRQTGGRQQVKRHCENDVEWRPPPGKPLVMSRPELGFVVLPVIPLDIGDFQIARNGRADGRKEVTLAELRIQSESLQLVLDGVLEFGKAKLDPSLVQRYVQLGDGVAGGDVDAGDGLGRNHQPAYGRRRFRDRIQDAFSEALGIGKKQRGIPPDHYQSGNRAWSRLPRHGL